MDQILDNLWISDISSVQQEALGDYGITKVVTVCQDSTRDNVGCSYSHYEMSDGPNNKYGGRYDYKFFSKAVDEVLRSIENDETVLVHCHKGRSRSGSVVIATVGVLKSTTYEEAERFVKNRRPVVNPDKRLVDNARKYISEKTE